jgi:hypothetical protein
VILTFDTTLEVGQKNSPNHAKNFQIPRIQVTCSFTSFYSFGNSVAMHHDFLPYTARIRPGCERTVTTGDFKNKVYFYFHSSTLTLFLQNFRQNNHCHQPSSPSTLPSLPKVFYSLCAVSSFFVKDFAILSSAHAHNLCDVHHGSVNCCAYWRDSEHAGQNSFLRFTCNAWTEFILAFFQERGSLLP